MNTLSFLSNAIDEMLVLKIFYDPGWRVIEPHALGYSSENNVLLRAYQTSGASASHEPVDWKLLRVDRIETAEPEGGTFQQAREGYRRGDKAMKGGIIAEL